MLEDSGGGGGDVGGGGRRGGVLRAVQEADAPFTCHSLLFAGYRRRGTCLVWLSFREKNMHIPYLQSMYERPYFPNRPIGTRGGYRISERMGPGNC